MGHRLLQIAERRGWSLALAAAAAATFVPLTSMSGLIQRQVVLIAIYALIVSGINLSLGFGGQLALGQVAMFAGGAYTTAILADHGHADLLLAVLASTLVAGLVGLLSGVPGLRLSHWSLSIASFFLILLIPRVVVIFADHTGGLAGLPVFTFPTLLGTELEWDGIYLFALGVAFLWLVIMRNLVLSRLGNGFRVLRESSLLAESLGLSAYRLRVQAYVLGGLPAGAAGCIYVHLNGYISPEAFVLSLTIALLAASVVGGEDSIYGAPIGAAILVLGPLQASGFEEYSIFVYGLFLVIVGVLFRGGLARLGRVFLRRLHSWFPAPGTTGAAGAAGDAAPESARLDIPGERLEVTEVRKTFGGLSALDGVSLAAEPGQITAIMGANGAGKTTLLNAISGLIPADSGSILLGRDRLDGRSGPQIARAGVSRTFQTPIIPRGMNVVEVVESGRLAAGRVGMLSAVLRLPRFRRARRDDHAAALGALRFAGLSHLASHDAQELPLGTRRLLEVVRAVAREPRVMLLDEPAAGLDDDGLRELATLMARARDAGATVILVEHNVRFVLDTADRIHVMELGRLLASGTPEEVRTNPAVVATYLGKRAGARTAARAAAQEASAPVGATATLEDDR